MSDRQPRKDELDLEYDLDAPPEKVWRAISLPEFRERWLPAEALVDAEAALVKPGEELRYRLREDASEVTFHIAPTPDGGTRLRIVHERASRRSINQACARVLMLAA